MADAPRRGKPPTATDRPLPGVRTTRPMGSNLDAGRGPRITPPKGLDAFEPRPGTASPRPPRDTLDGQPPLQHRQLTPSAPRVDSSAATRPPMRKVEVPEVTDPGHAPAIASDGDAAPRSKFFQPPDDRLNAAQTSASTQQMPALQQAVQLTPGDKTTVWVATHKRPSELDPRLILLREPDSQRSASFRVLRHRLQHSGDPRTIVVTSAVAGEGKTTCAANLALALGECGRARVLLVEANLREPSLAALFGFLPPACFAAQLTTHRDRPMDPWSVVEAFSPSLHVLAVQPGAEARPLLDGPSFAIAMDALERAGYDYIVVDTPPVLGSADVNLIEDCADGVLLATWARRSSARALRRAIQQLAPTRILGVTLLDA